MVQRLITEARQHLEDIGPSLNNMVLARFQQALDQAEREARQRASQFIEARDAEVRQVRDQALRELTSVRDDLQALTTEGNLGRISSSEYQSRLRDLADRQRQAEDALAKAGEEVERIASVEEDPIAWADDMAQRFPHMRIEVGF